MSKPKLKFSVSMCVYEKDNPCWFEESIQSILDQTYPPHEIVLIVDGPVPDSINNILQLYESDSLFKIVRLDENQGHGIARKIGLANCSNDLVALMDADDICDRNRFYKEVKLFEQNNKLDIVGGYIEEFSAQTNAILGLRKVPCTDKEIKDYMKRRCPMNQMTVMFKKKSVDEVGGYLDWFCNEDYYLWIRMAIKRLNFENIPEVLVKVRVDDRFYQRRGGFEYFKSESRLQKYMFDYKIIGKMELVQNISKRFLIQVILPNKIRGYVFRKLARTTT